MTKEDSLYDEAIDFLEDDYDLYADEMEDCIDMMPQMQFPKKNNSNGWTSFILGIVGSLGWMMPIIGLPITIVGTVLGAVGMKNEKHRGIAIAGFVINLVFLLVTIAKGVVDIVFYFRRKRA